MRQDICLVLTIRRALRQFSASRFHVKSWRRQHTQLESLSQNSFAGLQLIALLPPPLATARQPTPSPEYPPVTVLTMRRRPRSVFVQRRLNPNLTPAQERMQNQKKYRWQSTLTTFIFRLESSKRRHILASYLPTFEMVRSFLPCPPDEQHKFKWIHEVAYFRISG